ncbi:septal ring lytic transglycosylase RlpA family protein [Actinomadura fulvescens]|uniref:Probable endolytic peptidoglycan transglycosylase RlpA n=1 Tax=Actinomadura fulvescens TaxID=46160 RepID=A0ABN3PZL1_9ACTN
MGSPAQPRPRFRLRTILIASGVAVAVLAAGGWAAFAAGGDPKPVRSAQSAPQSFAPQADPPRATPTRASRGGAREATPTPKPKTVRPSAKPKPAKSRFKVIGSGSCEASYYWESQPTASGERFDPSELTAAHKTLPMGSKVRVTNKNNGKAVVVRINDRGPYVGGRCLDLSKAAMAEVGGTGAGVIPVRYQVLARR